jgi:hypothetical protein
MMFNPKPPVPDEEFSKDYDSFKDQTANLGFFTWFGVVAIVVIVGLVVWKLFT